MKSKIIFFTFIIILQFRCADNNNVAPAEGNVVSTAWVTIKDTDGKPMKNVRVELADQIGLTDEDGQYCFRNILMGETSLLKADRSGFFPGSRRFYPIENQIQYVDIILLPLNEAGILSGSNGGMVTIDANSNLSFPQNSITNLDGSIYSGSVHVMAYPIYADDPELSEKMPGTLLGTDNSSNSVVLASYGMLAIELQSDNGNKLQIASGKLVVMKISIPADMLSKAPSTIPLWYFDELEGKWKEDGYADKIGNQYVGNVSHFSYWNCDDSFEKINWSATFTFESGISASGLEVCLTTKNLNSQKCDRTNEGGTVKGEVPANEPLLMEVIDPCGTIIMTKEIGPYNSNHTGTVFGLPESILTTTLSGQVFDCDNKPVSKGHIRIDAGDISYLFDQHNADGRFEKTFMTCPNSQIYLQVIDENQNKVSLPYKFDALSTIDAGTIKVCETLDEFIRFRVTGFDKEYLFYFFDVDVYPQDSRTTISSVDTIGINGKFSLNFDGVTTGVYHTPSTGKRVNLPGGEYGYVYNLTINITQFGVVGSYIRGEFTGQISAGSNGTGGSGYSDFSGTFSVKRTN